MAPLIRNMSRHDAQWAKFKRSYMWNDIYHLRRTKFAVYQLATTTIGVGQLVGALALKHYNQQQKVDIPGFPDARFDTSDFVGSFAFNACSSACLGIVFGLAVFFDLFWPEREEARCVQRTWKLSAAASSVFQLAASLATTIIVATHGVHIHGVSVEQENVIRRNGVGHPLAYRQDVLALVGVVICWIGWLFSVWSTIIMWRAYAHNNMHGPFADHVRRGRDGKEILSEIGLGRF